MRPAPGQQLVDAVLRVSVDDAGDRLAQVGFGIDGVELAGLDERGDDGPVFGAAVRAGEQGVLSGQGDGGRIDRSTVLESISMVPSSMNRVRPLPSRQGVADDVGELALLADGVSFSRSQGSKASR